MAYFINGYPYSDTHNLNLDWVIDTLKRIETEMGQLHDGLEIHVTGNDGTEIFTFTVKANGVYITRADGGTPFFYNFDSQTLHAPYFDGQSFLFASGRTSGQMRAGNLVLDNALPIAQGGTGATTEEAARANLGAEAAFDVLPIGKGGTGATSAELARTALGAEATINVLPISKGGNGMVTGQAVGATVGTNVTMVSNSIFRFGQILALNFVVQVISDLAANDNIITLTGLDDTQGGPLAYIGAHRLDGLFRAIIKVRDAKTIIAGSAGLQIGYWYINACLTL